MWKTKKITDEDLTIILDQDGIYECFQHDFVNQSSSRT